MSSSLPLTPSAASVSDQALCQSFLDHGYLKFESVVDATALAELTRQIRQAFELSQRTGSLFVGGGTLSGHLNCFPGDRSRFVYERLQAAGVLSTVQALSALPLRAPNIGCNLNLPGSSTQNEHVDGSAERPFLIVNVAAVDTDLNNGAMEVLLGTQRKTSKYWRILLDRPERQRLCMKQGDVLIRSSTLWHRGMPNLSPYPRPMLAFTWEEGGSPLSDPYQVHGGEITFLPNRYSTGWAGRLRERAFVAAPRVGGAYRAVRSLF